jgi:hypothetical protein
MKLIFTYFSNTRNDLATLSAFSRMCSIIVSSLLAAAFKLAISFSSVLMLERNSVTFSSVKASTLAS